VVVLLLKIFWVVTWRHFLVYDQRFGITCLSRLKMGQTSDTETLVTHQRLTPGYNPKTFKQQLISYMTNNENISDFKT
jgi:hypothetical protein